MSQSENSMINALQELLQQLEAAQGGSDPEARSRLDQLRQQLGVLEQVKERAAAAGDSTSASAFQTAAPPPEAASCSAAVPSGGGPAPDMAVLQQMDGLAARLSGLEQKLADLDQGSLAVLQETAGGWLSGLPAAGSGVAGSGTQQQQQQQNGGGV